MEERGKTRVKTGNQTPSKNNTSSVNGEKRNSKGKKRHMVIGRYWGKGGGGTGLVAFEGGGRGGETWGGG